MTPVKFQRSHEHHRDHWNNKRSIEMLFPERPLSSFPLANALTVMMIFEPFLLLVRPGEKEEKSHRSIMSTFGIFLCEGEGEREQFNPFSFPLLNPLLSQSYLTPPCIHLFSYLFSRRFSLFLLFLVLERRSSH